MPFATITRYDEAAWVLAKPAKLQHGDLVARITASGQPGQERVVLKSDGKPPALLGYPKRMTPVEGDGALLGNYVDEAGNVLVIGHVTPPEAKAPKATPKAKAKSPSSNGKHEPTQDTTDTDDTPAVTSPSGKMTKSSAADALDALAIAVQAVANALR